MNKKFNNPYTWNDALVLDKIQEILKDKNLDDLEFTQEELENLKSQLNDSLSADEIHESACIVAQNVDNLKDLPKDNIKEYITNLIKYLEKTNMNCIIGECNGIEFEVFKDSDVDDVFSEYYSKYDETYGISNMLSDLGFDLK